MYIDICFCCTSVLLVFHCYTLIVDVWRSVLFCKPDILNTEEALLFEMRIWFDTIGTVYLSVITLESIDIELSFEYRTV